MILEGFSSPSNSRNVDKRPQPPAPAPNPLENSHFPPHHQHSKKTNPYFMTQQRSTSPSPAPGWAPFFVIFVPKEFPFFNLARARTPPIHGQQCPKFGFPGIFPPPFPLHPHTWGFLGSCTLILPFYPAPVACRGSTFCPVIIWKEPALVQDPLPPFCGATNTGKGRKSGNKQTNKTNKTPKKTPQNFQFPKTQPQNQKSQKPPLWFSLCWSQELLFLFKNVGSGGPPLPLQEGGTLHPGLKAAD